MCSIILCRAVMVSCTRRAQWATRSRSEYMHVLSPDFLTKTTAPYYQGSWLWRKGKVVYQEPTERLLWEPREDISLLLLLTEWESHRSLNDAGLYKLKHYFLTYFRQSLLAVYQWRFIWHFVTTKLLTIEKCNLIFLLLLNSCQSNMM